jgi:hypothetical protein
MHWRSQAKRAGVWLGVVALLAGAAFAIWLGTPYHGQQAGIDAVAANDDVVLQETGGGAGGYVMRPPGNPTEVGIVFYPGARVAPDAYVASLAPLVEEAHVTVVVPRVPLNFALLDHRAADGVRAAHPSIDRWYVGGHSLGGVAACRYAAANADDPGVLGLLLYGSRCDADVSGTDLDVLSITGGADTVLDRGDYEASLGRLPDDATVVSLDGVNHTQFGDYRGQPGDEPSGTTFATAHERLGNATLAWLEDGG